MSFFAPGCFGILWRSGSDLTYKTDGWWFDPAVTKGKIGQREEIGQENQEVLSSKSLYVQISSYRLIACYLAHPHRYIELKERNLFERWRKVESVLSVFDYFFQCVLFFPICAVYLFFLVFLAHSSFSLSLPLLYLSLSLCLSFSPILLFPASSSDRKKRSNCCSKGKKGKKIGLNCFYF